MSVIISELNRDLYCSNCKCDTTQDIQVIDEYDDGEFLRFNTQCIICGLTQERERSEVFR